MKKDQYFNLEVNFMSDEHVTGMMMELDPGKSVGIYLMLLLYLRKKDDYMASCSPESLKVIAWQNRVDVDMVDRIVRDFGLFEVDEQQQTFRSPYLDRVMYNLEEKWRQNSENGKKGGCPPKVKKTSETPMDKGQKPNENQENKVEEKRSITTVVNNSSNTEETATPTAAAVAAAVAVDTDTKNPVVPVDHTAEIIPVTAVRSLDEEGQPPLHFKIPIRLYDKADKRERKSQFETMVNGRRTNLGYLIPPEAPPRPTKINSPRLLRVLSSVVRRRHLGC